MSQASLSGYDAYKGHQGRNLELEKTQGILRLVTQLQAEGSEVLEQRVALLEIKERASQSVGETHDQTSNMSDSRLKEEIEANQAQVTRSLSYL